ncbi:MAG: hypothetical protein K2I53_14255, partial [Lachnospiraceae bacterium]|nr:hypothetical protein [Lachnospiraceae bacterium]
MYKVKRCYYYALSTVFICSVFLSGCGVTEKEIPVVADEGEIAPIQVDEMEVKSTNADKQKEISGDIEGENQADNQIEIGEIKNNNNNTYNVVKCY